MLESWKESWRELSHDSVGQRFTHLYQKQQSRGDSGLRWFYPIGALACALIGVVLAFIPGPAFVFFGLAFGLLAMQSLWVAKRLDRAEVTVRGFWQRLRRAPRGAGDDRG